MAGSPTEPTMDELRAFAVRLLSDMRELVAEPDTLDEAIQEHRDLWLMLYRVDRGDGPNVRRTASPSR
jgi:hypothetical protein